MQSARIRVAVVEDDTVFRNGLVRLIDSTHGFTCVAAVATGEEALQRLPEANPHVVLMDVNLPGMSGIECTRRLKEVLPQTNVMMLTVYEDSEHLFSALKVGASGYLLKRSEPEEVLRAIKEMQQGGAPMTSQIARKVVHSFRQANIAAREDLKLTEREQEILSYISKGYSNKEVSDTLSIALPTVRTHLRHVYEKLHVRSRIEAILKYLN